jgi:hypothetical protein
MHTTTALIVEAIDSGVKAYKARLPRLQGKFTSNVVAF